MLNTKYIQVYEFWYLSSISNTNYVRSNALRIPNSSQICIQHDLQKMLHVEKN